VNSYDIVASDAAGTGLSNYDIKYVAGTLTVDPAALTITATNDSKTYGVTKTLSLYSTFGLVNSDQVTGVTLASDGAVNTANVNSYDIVASDAAGTGLSNYDIKYVAGTLTVNKANLTVTADAKTKVAGDTDPALTYQVTAGGLVGEDAFTGALTRATGESAGDYAITKGTLALNDNYNLTYVGAFLTVSPVVVPPPTNLPIADLLQQRFIYPHAERLSEKLVNPMDLITSAGLMITGQVFFYHPLTKVDDASYNGFQLEQGAYDFIDGQIEPCDPTGKSGKPCKKN
jgi:hypothetical protein